MYINRRIVHVRENKSELHTGVPAFRRLSLPRMFEVERGMLGVVTVREEQNAPIHESEPMSV